MVAYHHEGAGEEDPRVRKYELVLEEDRRLDAFDMEIVLRTILQRYGFHVMTLKPTDGHPTYAEIQARELTLTKEDEEKIEKLLRGEQP